MGVSNAEMTALPRFAMHTGIVCFISLQWKAPGYHFLYIFTGKQVRSILDDKFNSALLPLSITAHGSPPIWPVVGL
jgi:hypothetical protein